MALHWLGALLWLGYYIVAMVLVAGAVRQAQPRLMLISGFGCGLAAHLLGLAVVLARFGAGATLPATFQTLHQLGHGTLSLVGYGLIVGGLFSLTPRTRPPVAAPPA